MPQVPNSSSSGVMMLCHLERDMGQLIGDTKELVNIVSKRQPYFIKIGATRVYKWCAYVVHQ